jgi:hypothetical protein
VSNFTNYLEDALIQYFLRNDADTFSPVATLYLALYTAAPGEAGGGTEVADANGYAREAIAFTDPAGGGATENTAQIDFTASGGAWGTVSHITVSDNASHDTGNDYLYGALGTSRAVGDGETLRFAAGDIDLVVD